MLGLSVGLLAACTPTPEPTPTPTALFASDEEAYAAAEETYRAYNDAINAQRSGDITQDPQDFLIGAALEADIDGRRELAASGLNVEGDVRVVAFTPIESAVTKDRRHVGAFVCLDLSKTQVLLDNGDRADLPDRPPVIAQEVEMSWIDGNYRISAELDAEVAQCNA